MNDDIYTMKLHEEIFIGNSTGIMRVPGGWIYTYTHQTGSSSSVFAPMDSESDNYPRG